MMGSKAEETAWSQLVKGFQYYAKEVWISFCRLLAWQELE